jgi:uncharacterized membrane protein
MEKEKDINMMCMLYPNMDPKRAHIMQELMDGLNNLAVEMENARFAKLYAKCDDYFKTIVDKLRTTGASYGEVLFEVNKIRNSIIEEVANKFLSAVRMDCDNSIINHKTELIYDIKKSLLSRTDTIKSIRFRVLTRKIKKYNK